MMYRLPVQPGEWLDRSQPLWFTFEGRRYQGCQGDTITSALAAAGVMILGRSFKYHRPRGVLSFANHDANALFQLGTSPNVRGDVVALEEGMCVQAVNTFGGLATDSARVLDALARFLPVGFYYKAFHSRRLFPFWERWIRKLGGLGRIPPAAAGPRPPKRHAFCDVLVIGGGTSGVAAALTAAQAGAQVLLVDEQPQLSETAQHSLSGQSGVRVLSGAYVAGCYADHYAAVITPSGLLKVRSRATVLATGASEQPLVFRNNDLPGVLLTSAACRLAQRYAVAAGRRVVVATDHQGGYETALQLLDCGIAVQSIIDARSGEATEAAALSATLQARGVKRITNRRVVQAHAGRDGCVRGISIGVAAQLPMSEPEIIECDALLMSGGRAPALQLLLQAGGKVAFDEPSQMFVPAQLPEQWQVAGGANGVLDANASHLDGVRAGATTARSLGLAAPPETPALPARRRAAPATIHADRRGKDFIDFDEDVQVRDLEQAAEEGFDSIELLKRYTTVGMGPSQGKHSNLNAARVLARVRELPLEQIGLTTARPLYHPVPLQHLAGRRVHIERATPLTDWHERAGAAWMWAGNWRRPLYYARAGQSAEDTLAAEVAVVRERVGLIDVSTLGKLEVHGPEAAEFLDRAYAGRYSNLKVGMTRYALLLDEAGTIVDDGVIARLHESRFYVTTTTTGAVPVYRELLRLNAQWGLDCALVNLTGHQAAFNLAGPNSRAVLQEISSIYPSDSAFPYLAVRTASIAGVAARLLRVGFVSDLGFEIHVPFSQARTVWQALYDAGLPLGLRPFGVAAQRLLRLERGHFIVGQDTDGLTNPFEAQAKWAVRMDKPFFVGQRSLRILQQRGPRQLLVGFEIPFYTADLQESHLVIDHGNIAGRVTSVGFSATLGKTIGLAMVQPSLAVIGAPLQLRLSNGRLLPAQVCPTPFLTQHGH